MTNLTETTNILITNSVAGLQTDVVYTDFSKAFDCIPHNILLLKLSLLGFPDFFVKWVKSYLSDRIYRVKYQSSLSEPFEASSGVPQGSHLGPLLFIISINDVTSILKHAQIKIFADDIKILTRIESVSDCLALQTDLFKLGDWCDLNGLSLNIEKCSIVSFSRKTNILHYDYSLNGLSLSRRTVIKDLGVYFDHRLTFKDHYIYISNRGNSLLGFIKRWSKEFSDPYVTKALFELYVRPSLEYASTVWSPHLKTDINRVEAVQRRFLRFALRSLPWTDNYCLPPYVDRLKLLGMMTLCARRIIADVVFLHQIIENGILSPSILSSINWTAKSVNLRRVDALHIKTYRTNYGMSEPLTRSMREFNAVWDHLDLGVSKRVVKSRVSHLNFVNHPL